ncbi:MAG TPA: hypothetical protein VJH05_00285 [Candidatus Paceibacterota bacterium]
MIGLLPKVYSQEFKKEKIIKRIFIVFILWGLFLAFGVVFLLPSYFTLVFSLDDVLRSLGTEEVAIKRKNVEGLESTISYTNSLLDSYFLGVSKQKSFSELLFSLTKNVSNGVKLTGVEFQKSTGGEFVFLIRGEAATRNSLILFSQKIRQLPEVKDLRSPVSNLLQETEVKFLLEALINPQFYEYKN